MSDDALKLTVHFGERARAGRAFLADALVDVYARHGLRASVVLRAMEGFGAAQRVRTDRLLSLSEDLPLVAVAVDERPRIEAALADVRALPGFTGLVTLERARVLTDGRGASPAAGEAAKLTVYVGRRERAGRRAAAPAVVDLLRRHGVDGATVLLGVDGTVRGQRRRARVLHRNAAVPMMIVAVGDGPPIAAALGELAGVLAEPLATLERVRIVKRDGRVVGRPHAVADTDPYGLGVWQKLTVITSEAATHEGRPLHHGLLRELRAAGAAGATTLRGIWGYHGDHAPHGDVLLQLRRRVPVVLSVVDAPSATERWLAIVDDVTHSTGLVTSELVPALRATDGRHGHGGLRLARRAAP
ncbi:DUF190 domain-containing protein [Baekduia soli]|uniref:DUF190 domain-containing protein n=1 Tax=Baekduia soli TaxID=496014 RepID=A0A5B8UC87_9ACTN|nr:DUF190 domain-containing protein [Baekduia soli]QEC50584.1 DUF190 domain-containing protein [Baekduia soli]